MANYHLHADPVTRGNGGTVVGVAAYFRGACFYDDRYGEKRDFLYKSDDVIHSEFNTPKDAPRWLLEMVDNSKSISQDFWNCVEASERAWNAQLGRMIEFSLPVELTKEQNIQLAREFIQEQFVALGMVADWSVHWDNPENPHVHCLLTTRPLEEEGFGKRKAAVLDPESGEPMRDKRGAIVYRRGDLWGSNEQLRLWRAAWADYQNFHLRMHGHDVQVDHRSYKDQGLQLEPTKKIGVGAFWMEKRGIASDRFSRWRAERASIGRKVMQQPEIVLEKIARQKSVFHVRDIEREIERYFEKGSDDYAKAVDAVLASKLLVQLGERKKKVCYALEGTIAQERAMVETAGRMKEASGHAVDDLHIDTALARLNTQIAQATDGVGKLSKQQEAAAQYVVEQGGIKVLVGVAGAGKSTILQAANEAWQSSGYRVRGAALSGIAAQNLQDSGITAQTLHSLEGQWRMARALMDENVNKPLSEKQRNFIQSALLTDKDVLVIDEAGMVGAAQMQRVLAEAERAGAKVVLVGDDEQLQSIEAGAAFTHIRKMAGGVSLDEVRRQRIEWQRSATIQLATQKTYDALKRYEATGHVHFAEDKESAHERLLTDYMRSYGQRPEASRMILTYARADVEALNTKVQEAMLEVRAVSRDWREVEVIGQDNQGEYRYRERFAAGDRIMFRENNRDMGVMNGTLGTVRSIDEGGYFTVALDNGRELSFSAVEYSKFQLGYAATVHKSQGVTVDEAFVYAARMFDRHSTYVAMSRHRDRVDLYGDKETFTSIAQLKYHLARATERPTTLDFAIDRGITPSELLRRRVANLAAHAWESIEQSRVQLGELWQRLESAYGKLQGREVARVSAKDKRRQKEARIVVEARTREIRLLALRERMLAAANRQLDRATAAGTMQERVTTMQAAARYGARLVALGRAGEDKTITEQQLLAIGPQLRAIDNRYVSILRNHPALKQEQGLREANRMLDAAVKRTLEVERRAEAEALERKRQEKGLEKGE
jgi:ATP-dependent exoDNAse (exonuclease V) alpha subunit